MSAYLLAGATASLAETTDLGSHPEFRRATANMKLAYLAATKVLKEIPPDLALVIGTSFGELGATCDFMSGLALEGVARPLAFQNSLHHSTLGFVSRVLKIKGPGYTVSREYFSGEEALSLAGELLHASTNHVLVIGVDVLVESLRPVMESRVGRGLGSGSGAAAVLLSNTAGDVAVSRVECYPSRPPFGALIGDGYYDSNAIEKLVTAWDSNPADFTLTLPKPDGTWSEIVVNRQADASIR